MVFIALGPWFLPPRALPDLWAHPSRVPESLRGVPQGAYPWGTYYICQVS